MSKNVLLYTVKEKNMGIYYCMDDGWYYYKDMGKANFSLTLGIVLIWNVICGYLRDLTISASTWNMIFIASNILLFVFLRSMRKAEEKKLHKYYPEHNQFINNLTVIKREYFKHIISTVICGILTVVSIFCWVKYNDKLTWLMLEILFLILFYCLIVLNGIVFKRKIIKQIECGEI